MRALVLEDFGRMVLTELEDPVAVADEVVVRIIATGICGSDIHGYTGENGRRVRGQVMGHETVGIIDSLGPDARRSDLSRGTLVTINPVILPAEDVQAYAGREQHDASKRVLGVDPGLISAFAEKVTVPERNIVTLPKSMPVLYGALIEPLAVAVNAVRRSGARAEDRVLVLGGGPIGQSIVLALQMAGVRSIVVTEVMPSRQELLRHLGAVVIDPTVSDVRATVLETFGRPADLALDAVGLSQTLDDALASTRLGGMVCLVGMGHRTLEVDAFKVSAAERSVVGSFTYANHDFEQAAAWLATAPDAAEALISRGVTLDQADAAFRGLAGGDGTAGKVMVILDPSRVPTTEGVPA